VGARDDKDDKGKGKKKTTLSPHARCPNIFLHINNKKIF
jgi:hypothetical protein